MMSNLGLSEDQVVEKTLIPEDESAYDAEMCIRDSMESAPHPKQVLYIDLGHPLEKYDILRRKE